MNLYNNIFIRVVFYLLFFLMMVFPMVIELIYFKVFLFAILLGYNTLISLKIKKENLLFHPSVLKWQLIILYSSIAFWIDGLIENTPGASKQAEVFVFWPLIYSFLLTALRDPKLLKGLRLTIIVSTIFVSLYGISHVLADLLILPKFFSLSPFKSEIIGLGYYSGFIEMTMPGINSLSFLIPFTIAECMLWLRQHEKSPINKKLLLAALIISILFSLMTARKGVWLVILLSPVLFYFFNVRSINQIINRKINFGTILSFLLSVGFLLLIFGIAAPAIYKFDLNAVFNDFIYGFDFVSTDFIRKEQFYALIRGISQHPIFGSGLGATAAQYGSLRSVEAPWSYELEYLAILFQIGVVGVLILISGIFWTYSQSFKMIKSDLECKRIILPFILGMTGIFITGATNPIFLRYDGLWFFFIPLAIINNWKLES